MRTAADPKSPASLRQTTLLIGAVEAMTTRFKDIMNRLGETACNEADAWRDPLSHPAIRRMSSRELADLPFSAARHDGRT